MIWLTWGLIAGGFCVIAVAAFWAWSKALGESLGHGLGYLWQPYALYYLWTRWPMMRKPFLLGLTGVVCVIIGTIIGSSPDVLPHR